MSSPVIDPLAMCACWLPVHHSLGCYMVVSTENFGGTLTMPWIPMKKNDNHLAKMKIDQKMKNKCEVCLCACVCVVCRE